MSYTIHTIQTAPEAAKQSLEDARAASGFVHNLLGVMAEAPALLKAYRALSGFFKETSFTPTERQVVLMTANYENGCEYCVAAHTVIAGREKVPDDVVAAMRNATPIKDSKLEALRRFTAVIVKTRGWPTKEDVEAFLGAGYAEAQVLEVILGVGLKTLANYTNHIAETPLDEAFMKAAWSKAS